MQIVLRAHHLLCLQGLRGLGYSPAFVENMAALQRRLSLEQETLVVLTNQADAICAACPHLQGGGACANGAPEVRDDAVLEALRVRAGAQGSWSHWLKRLAVDLEEQALARVCAGCPWLGLDYCAEAVRRLRTRCRGDDP